MFIFLSILILGLVYVWCKGDLEWIKAKPTLPTTDVTIPASLYEQLNMEQGKFVVKPFSMGNRPATAEGVAAETPETAPPVRKPMFKPTFKKPSNE